MNTLKTFTPVLLLIGIVFVGCGDQFLPEPLKGASTSSRRTVNNVVKGFFPERERKTNPYERTEEAIDDLEHSGQQKK